MAGLSLGEYSALYAAGVFDAATAVSLAAFRGKAMERPCRPPLWHGRGSGTGSGIPAAPPARRRPDPGGVVEIANYNCPGQMAIAGDKAAVDAACEAAKAAGAKRCVPLNVSGPFHTSLMAPAGDALREKFKEVSFGEMSCPVYFNCLGAPKADNDTIHALLEKQVQSSVYMEDIIRRMAEDGVDAFLEVGPGKTLAGLVKKTVKGAAVRSVETAEDLAAALEWLKGERPDGSKTECTGNRRQPGNRPGHMPGSGRTGCERGRELRGPRRCRRGCGRGVPRPGCGCLCHSGQRGL